MPPMVLYRILGVTDIILGSRAAAGAIVAIGAGVFNSTSDFVVWSQSILTSLLWRGLVQAIAISSTQTSQRLASPTPLIT